MTSNQQPATNLSIYIHWPFCKSKCPYCDFNSHVREQVEFDRWQKALLAELDYMHCLASEREVVSIFFGGGTPSLMPPAIAQALIERIKQLWPTSPTLEITLEANPTSVEAETFPRFKAAGINRVSLGVQSLRQKELTFLGRGHNVEEAKRAVALAAEHFERYSFDLIYARPEQTLEEWREELSEALALTRGHLSLYQLTIEENTAFFAAYAKGAFAMPGEEHAEALYLLTEELCAAHGLSAYEVSNYAKPGQESRHNLAYWLGYEYLGIGPGAHGRMMIQGQRHATHTIKSPERWLEAVERAGHGLEACEKLGQQTEAEERLMMGLRVKDGIDYAQFQTTFGFDLRNYINMQKCAFFTEQGLLEPHPHRLQPTMKGRLLLSSLTAALLGNS